MMNKHSKAEEHYRKGHPLEHCGICTHFQTPSRCSVTSEKGSPTPGIISPYGTCDAISRPKNPFGSGVSASDKADLKKRLGL